ncbi:MAG: hypothetical protein CMJ90_14150 [Planctomycetes bacterium]|nr:hypothetical protein [Planctomycetota bacterium]
MVGPPRNGPRPGLRGGAVVPRVASVGARAGGSRHSGAPGIAPRQGCGSRGVRRGSCRGGAGRTRF